MSLKPIYEALVICRGSWTGLIRTFAWPPKLFNPETLNPKLALNPCWAGSYRLCHEELTEPAGDCLAAAAPTQSLRLKPSVQPGTFKPQGPSVVKDRYPKGSKGPNNHVPGFRKVLV